MLTSRHVTDLDDKCEIASIRLYYQYKPSKETYSVLKLKKECRNDFSITELENFGFALVKNRTKSLQIIKTVKVA